ncbi:symmetrical bis(5'-nucleosyl)-tetraphosphatase [Methylobacillus flagellatus]|uniref:Bis(5'-nucleosyl)-tetraphosphatase, symmetrical n=1 Tax=Methylobacillus flagellatus (strain ATCC 51484 / DSM 6875 / VKM B-1610 / KT) TaxID=265072 RepID=APAH_METFK|nr:symmetrical bis(5'-nucleosyl)-tetraphosphatase [Methylobacillus flagellatus]Q1H450.1 RecName: Full=Bis(5'-nucleosyl)-tetraphosphatase, symmetrical; AltName: Full=Ap4A hydrolase; AltName: Full=Diadenosine 5',5'''-P1,P4-tetraphosphate pyrophosphohydrolase; AltName: Full=Diadenosine tetraphosphatase [Methylobacillus flagellatus KT]ABE48737.1 Bis(5'nucleosyl)-tetraphosphatase, ApaH [Methylobacillus flagellatus KT]
MATYAIGDIQGCYHSLLSLLELIQFDPVKDKLWLVGDLINRGPGSLETLRWAKSHESSLVMVLGNHDLHALAVAEGYVRAHRSDTLQSIFDAPDRDELLEWLRFRPMMHAEDGMVLVHAGLLPQWSAEQALHLGQEVERALRGDDYHGFLAHMYGNYPVRWEAGLQGMDRLRMITNAMTRLRVCTPDGAMDFDFKGKLADIPPGKMPWFDVPERGSADVTVIFGHWSALGLQQRDNLYALDTGCLWGGKLTALRLEGRQIFQVPCHPADGVRAINGS